MNSENLAVYSKQRLLIVVSMRCPGLFSAKTDSPQLRSPTFFWFFSRKSKRPFIVDGNVPDLQHGLLMTVVTFSSCTQPHSRRSHIHPTLRLRVDS